MKQDYIFPHTNKCNKNIKTHLKLQVYGIHEHLVQYATMLRMLVFFDAHVTCLCVFANIFHNGQSPLYNSKL